MKNFFRNLFLSHWERKMVSLVLAVVIWLMVNHSLTTTKTIENIAVRVINIPSEMTIDGLQTNGLLKERIPLTLSGNKQFLDVISSNDLEVVIDAIDKIGEWAFPITKSNLISLNPEVDLSKMMIRVSPHCFLIKLTRMVTEKIPVVVTYPIGEAPMDYQFVGVWPYHFNLTISGPEETVKEIKTKGLNLTFNLSNISNKELDKIHQSTPEAKDEVSFLVPEEWKKIAIPPLFERPVKIDDPQAKFLRIDFVRNDLHPISKAIPLSLFYPPQYSLTLNPENYTLSTEGVIQHFHGIPMIRKSLYTKGVSRLFVELVQDMIEISVLMAPKNERRFLEWGVQFINPKTLEDRYVARLMADRSAEEEFDVTEPKNKEEYLRNRFRNYMSRFQLFKSNDALLNLNIELQDNKVCIEETP